MKNLILFITITLLTINITAQNSSPFRIMDEETYFDAYLQLIEKKDEFMDSKYQGVYLQAFGTLCSQIGKHKGAIDYFIIRNKYMGFIPDTLRKIDLSDYGIKQDSLNILYNNYNVTMFNESHNISRHRAFIYSQLEILKSLGYTQLALETLNKKDSFITNRKYPVKKTGFYTNDPVYGNLIRKALELDFTLISYENISKRREKGQAENIYKHYDSSKGKLIVYGGYGHISETGEYKMMGQHLKNMLNEDLLTISQFTQFSVEPVFPSDSEFDFFLKKDDMKQFDYYFYAKPKPSDKNIPYWYSWMNFKTKRLNEIYNKPMTYPTLIQLHNINEKDAVPVFQYMIEKEEDVLIAYPTEGEYKLKIIDKTGETDNKINLKE